jgi:DNA polymerase-3 subunit epsilon
LSSGNAQLAMKLWRKLFPERAPFELDSRRWVVLDVEASGLDPRRDRLLSIAALALDLSMPPRAPSIRLADSFEVVLRQPEVDQQPAQAVRDNILLHGIGLGAQAAGVDPAAALTWFARYAGRSPLVAFHSFFDKALIDRQMLAVLGHRLPNPWIDLEQVAAVLCRQPRRLSLDDWMRRFDIRCEARHQAAADTLATAELLLKLWPLLQARQQASWQGFEQVAGEANLLPGRR